MTDERDTRERILDATIQVIEDAGMDGLTVRRIAERAHVNVAAVNYHFGSKDRLVETVLSQTLRHGLWESLDELRAAAAEGGSDGIRAYLRGFIGDALQYPRLTEAHFHDVIVQQDYSGDQVAQFNAFLEGMFQVVRPALRPGSEAEQRRSLAHFWNALVAAIIMPRLMAPFLGGAPSGETGWPPDGYVDRLLEAFLD